jgi:AraC-like DNA-binding protein
MTNNYFKYLPYNPDDSAWGIYLTVAGGATVEPDSNYPPAKHPSGYHFNWNNGRILHEFQINYITEGEGILETREKQIAIKAGSVMVIHPNVWHRYRPLSNVGWTEHYVGFTGETAERMIQSSEILRETAVIQIGFNEEVIQLYDQILHQVKSEKPGYQQICSGLAMQVMGHIISVRKNKDIKQGYMEKSIQKACLLIRDNQTQNIQIEEIAKELKVNYSHFRKAFKRYTGLSPLQYHASLRLKQATDLLVNTDLSIKEISFDLGFCSVFYFSKLFKEKTGKTPGDYRRQIHEWQ